MQILKWDQQTDIFPEFLDPAYKNRDGCDVYYVDQKGFAVLNFEPKYPLYQKLGIPEIQDIFVLPDARRQGVASALIKHCESLCNTDMIGISVPVSTQFGAAQQLYAYLGYIPDGNGVTYDRETVHHGHHCKVDDLLCLMLIKEL